MRPRPPALSNAPIDLDRYAEIMACVRHFPEDKKDEIVARLGLRRLDWEAAATRWSKDLATSLDEASVTLVERYATAFARARRRLLSLRPSIESLGPVPEPEEPEKPEVSVPPPAPFLPGPRPPAEPTIERPSYLFDPVPAPAAATPMSVVCTDLPLPRAQVPQVQVPQVQVQEMPFKAPEAVPGEGFERAVAHANAVQGAPQSPPVWMDATVAGGLVNPEQTLPFARPSRPVPDYTVERYASLCVELEQYVDHAAEVMARYQLDGETCNALHAHWKSRFSVDPTLSSTFLEAYHRYSAWLTARDGNG